MFTTTSSVLLQAQASSDQFVTEVCVGEEFEGIGSPVFSALDRLKLNRNALMLLWRVNPQIANSIDIESSPGGDHADAGSAERSVGERASQSPQETTESAALQTDAFEQNESSEADHSTSSSGSAHTDLQEVSHLPHRGDRGYQELSEIRLVQPASNSLSKWKGSKPKGWSARAPLPRPPPFSSLRPYTSSSYTKLESRHINESNLLCAGDRLILSCKSDSMQHLRRMRGYGLTIGESLLSGFQEADSEFIELVVSHACPYIGKAICSAEVREAYNFCGIVGARRHGLNLPDILTDTKLSPGDTLLVVANSSNLRLYQASKDFYVASSIGGIPNAITWCTSMPLVPML